MWTHRDGHTQSQRRSSDNAGRDWNDAGTSRRTPGIASNHQNLGRGRKGSSLEPSEHGPADTLTLDF